jgi:replicative DNA helicase
VDAERALLGKAIHGQQLDAMVSAGIEVEHFADSDCRAVYATMREHLSRYGQPPTAEAINDRHPEFPITVSGEAVEYLIDRFLVQVKRRKAIELYRDFGEACDDPDRVLEIEVVAMEMASTLMDIVPSPRVGRYSEEENRIEEYIREKAMGKPRGMEIGFPDIDFHIVGLQPHEFMVVAGWQNSGKSLIMQRVAWHFYSVLSKRPLYISLEMSKEECYGRWTSMATGIEHRSLRAMELAEDSADFKRWRQTAAAAKQFRAERDILCIDDIGSCTPDRVLVETRRYEPDVVFVDYLELMDPPRSGVEQWQGIDQIGRQLKRNARLPVNGRHIPVVVGAQTNADDGGRGASLTTISYKSTGKHADIVLTIKRTEEMIAARQMELEIAKNRNGRRGVVQELHCDPSVMSVEPLGARAFGRRQEVLPDPSVQPAPPPPDTGLIQSPLRRRVA